MTNDTAKTRLAEVIASLALASDLGMGQSMDHALRRCLIALRLGEALGLSEAELGEVYYVALVCSVGCTIKLQGFTPWFSDELAFGAGVSLLDPLDRLGGAAFLVRHAGEGYPPLQRAQKVVSMLANGQKEFRRAFVTCHEVCKGFGEMLGFEPPIQDALGQIHERWDGHGEPLGLKGEEKALAARIAHLAEDVETFDRMGGADTAVAMVRQRSGKAYDPRIAELFYQEGPQLLSELEAEPVWETVLTAEPGPWRWLSGQEFERTTKQWPISLTSSLPTRWATRPG
ncbi:MAG: hypothetical protein FJ315_02500 [SAR202 cluster bacterium]|nr:hypothetical protein [SAR202 cluster bacterium]